MVNLTLLTQPACGYCDQAKEIISRLSIDFALNIREVDLETEEGRALAIQNAVMFAPGIFLNGKLFSYGRLSEKKLRLRLTKEYETESA